MLRTLLVTVVTFFCFVSIARAYTVTGRFYIQGTKMIDPSGKEFIPIGCNVNGKGWVWSGAPNTSSMVNAVVNGWKFNCLRVNNVIGCANMGTWGKGPFQNADLDLDSVVSQYTRQKVVIMFEDHDVPSTVTELECTAAWYKDAAKRYKNNPYVWFNPMNEPSDIGAAAWAQCVPMYRKIIANIRDSAGADNIIICDGAAAGQDQISSWGGCDYTQTSSSAILTYGDTLAKFNGKTYANIGFSFHSYGAGNCTDTAQNTAIMKDYLTKIHAKNIYVIVGECGTTGDNWNDWGGRAVTATLGVAPYMGVGVLAWHGQPGDGFCLVWQNNSCGIDAMNTLDNPPRMTGPNTGEGLTLQGAMTWDLTHRYGFGLGSNISTEIIDRQKKSDTQQLSNITYGHSILLSNMKPGSKIAVYALNGREIYQAVVANGMQLEISPPNYAGYYIARVIAPDQKAVYTSGYLQTTARK